MGYLTPRACGAKVATRATAKNFGTFKAENRLTYFDINDFDEATLAPCTYDPVRLATSTLLAGKTLGLKGKGRNGLARVFVDGYADALQEGTARWVEAQTVTGMLGHLLETLEDRTRLAPSDRDGRTVAATFLGGMSPEATRGRHRERRGGHGASGGQLPASLAARSSIRKLQPQHRPLRRVDTLA